MLPLDRTFRQALAVKDFIQESQPKHSIGDKLYIISVDDTTTSIVELIILGVRFGGLMQGDEPHYRYQTTYNHPQFKDGIPEEEFYILRKDALNKLVWIEDVFLKKGE
jgi:hypothetical protein